MLLLFRASFNLVNVAVVCTIPECISGLELSPNTEPRHFKLVTVSSICLFNLLVDVAGVGCHQLGLLGTDLHAVGCGGFVETLS